MLDELRLLMDDEFASVLNNYRHITPKLMGELQVAISRRQTEDVVRLSHRIKSASAQIGAIRFASMAKDIERFAKMGNLKPAQGLFAKASKVYQHVDTALRMIEQS